MSKENSIFDLNPQEILKTKKETKKEKVLRACDLWINNQDLEAFQTLMRYYYPRVQSFAWKYVQDIDIAKDCAAETFQMVYEKTEKYYKQQGNMFQTWIFTICRNICLITINRKKKEGKVDSDISDLTDNVLFKKEVEVLVEENNENYKINPDTLLLDTPADKEIIIKETYDASIKEIENLDELSSNMIKMKFVEGKRIQDIAEYYNVGESFVKNRIYNGIKIVKKNFLKKNNDLYEMWLDTQNEDKNYLRF